MFDLCTGILFYQRQTCQEGEALREGEEVRKLRETRCERPWWRFWR